MKNSAMGDEHERPNILLVMCDQLSAMATSPYGNVDVISPNLMSLADRGVTFENAYCNAPLCAPSRASMMTGRLPGSIPVNDNSEELPSAIPTFVHYLRRAGYATVLSGKMHFVGPDQLHGFEERLTTDIYRADFGSVEDWTELGDPPRQPAAQKRGRYMAHMVKDAGPVDWSAQLDYDEEVHFRAVERIRQFSRRSPDAQRPWFLCVSYTQPHDPYAPSREYWDKYEGREISMPSSPPDDYAETTWDRWVNGYHGVDIAEPTDDEIARARRGYYAMTTYIDDKLGDLQRELSRFDELENTIVIFVSDHGDMMGEHGMFFKRTFREWSVRVPLIVAGPNVGKGNRVKAPVSLVDLFPTILGLARIDDHPEVSDIPGTDILSREVMEGGDASPVIIDYSGNGTIAPTRTVVRGRFKYVYVHRYEELLFDLDEDPDEWHNLVALPAMAATLDTLRSICLAGWDPVETERQILADQKVRVLVSDALSQGVSFPWDFQPTFDATRMNVRRPIERIWDRGYTKQFSPHEGGL